MKKAMKKTLSVMLSLLMIVSFVPFTASAAETDGILAAMDAYEEKMDGTIYYDMLDAYNAYIDAREAYDAYCYGEGTAAQLDAATEALVDATADMSKWTVPKFQGTAYHCANPATNGYSNVVYCTLDTHFSGANTYDNSYISIAQQNVKIAMPREIVFCYDGINDVCGPVVFEHVRDGNHQTNIKWVGADDGDWEFRDFWYGYTAGDGLTYEQWPGNTKTADSHDLMFGYSADTYYDQVATTNNTTSRFYWNKLYFKGTPDTTKYYTKTYRQTFHMVGYQNNVGNSGNREGTIYSDNTQYVINYAPALAQLDSTDPTSVAGKFTALAEDGTIPLDNYTQGGLRSLIGTIDKLVNSRPSNYDFSISIEGTVIMCADAIKAALSDAASATVTEDACEAAYENLREAIVKAKPLYQQGNDSGVYNATLWNFFEQSYTAAVDNMTNLPVNGYSSAADAQRLADMLNSVYNSLSTVLVDGTSGNTEYNFDRSSGTLTVTPAAETDGKMDDYGSAIDSPFANNSDIKEIVIDSGVTHIGAHAFDGDDNLTVVTVPAGATFGEGAFDNCPNLTTVIITGGEVTNESAENAPWNNPSVTVIKLGTDGEDKSVTGIGNDVFTGKEDSTFYVYNPEMTIPDADGIFGTNPKIYAETPSTASDYCQSRGVDFTETNHTEHVWSDDVVVAPTCDKTGYTTHTCIYCDYSEKFDEVPALGHSYVGTELTPATCTNAGVMLYTCQNDASHMYVELIPITGHDWQIASSTASCTTPGVINYACANCEATKQETYEEPLGHNYVANVVAPTCSTAGYTEHVCSRCNDTYCDTFTVDSTAHDWDDGVVTREATVEETGIILYTCKNDPTHTKTVSIPKATVAPVPTAAEANSAPVNKQIKKVNKISTVSNIGKKTMTIKFSKISGAQNYRVAFRQAGAKTWKYYWTGGKSTYVLKKLKANQLYEFKFAAYKKNEAGKWERGDWSTTAYRYFQKVNLKSVSTKKKTITVKWAKDKNANYYEVYYSLKSDMSGAKKVKVAKSKTSTTIKKLKKGKKYYVRVRAVKTKSKKNYVGEFSAKKNIKCK